MVWGLREPSGFGQFFLDGDYVGFDDRLKDYFSTQMSDAEKAEMGMPERFSYTAFYNKFTKNLGPLKPHECPTEFQVQFNQATSFGSLVKLTSKLLTVDEALKTIIKTLDPGVHQFWPIEIKLPWGKPFPRQFYGLRIGRFLDSFSPEASSFSSFREEFGMYYVDQPTKELYAGLVMRSEIIGTSNLWREKKLKQPEICFSDRLKEAIDEAGLRLPKLHEMKEV
jgi:hypothetical protein